jgi:hypothetical protein
MHWPGGAPARASRRGSREAEAQEVSAPIPIGALEQHVVIVGRTGGGKSYAGLGAVEQLLEEGRQVVVLDRPGTTGETADGIGPSAAGCGAAGEVGPPPSSNEMVSHWCAPSASAPPAAC